MSEDEATMTFTIWQTATRNLHLASASSPANVNKRKMMCPIVPMGTANFITEVASATDLGLQPSHHHTADTTTDDIAKMNTLLIPMPPQPGILLLLP